MTRLANVGRPGPAISVLDGGDVEPQTGRLLSIAELRQAMHTARAGRDTPPAALLDDQSGQRSPDSTHAGYAATALSTTPALPGKRSALPAPVAAAVALPHQSPVIAPARPRATKQQRAQPPGPFVLVLAAQAGSGASTVGLALADAAAAAGREVQLVSGHGVTACGLLAVPHIELGGAEAAWRRGRRGDLVLVDRSRTDDPAVAWPQAPVPADVLRVLDAPLGSPLARTPPVTVLLVCRASVPGVQRAEHLLRRLEAQRRDVLADGALDPTAWSPRVLLAVVGPDRWAGPVSASVGVGLQRLQHDGRVVGVPLDRHLDLTGPSADPLPKAVLKAGRVLLQHVEADLSAFADRLPPVRSDAPASVSPHEPRTSPPPKDRS